MEFKSLRLTCFQNVSLRIQIKHKILFQLFPQLFYFPLSNAMSNRFQLIPFVRTSSDVINLHQELKLRGKTESEMKIPSRSECTQGKHKSLHSMISIALVHGNFSDESDGKTRRSIFSLSLYGSLNGLEDH